MQANFRHPRDSRTFSANVDPETTADRCIQGLVKVGFIEPYGDRSPYSLMLDRTNQQLLPSTTMSGAGVRDQDDLVVLQSEQGA